MPSDNPAENLGRLRELAERIVAATDLKLQREKAIAVVRRAQCQVALERLRALGWGYLKIASSIGMGVDRPREPERGYALTRPGEPELLEALADVLEGSPETAARFAAVERIADEFLTAFAERDGLTAAGAGE